LAIQVTARDEIYINFLGRGHEYCLSLLDASRLGRLASAWPREAPYGQFTVYDHALTRPWTVNKRYSRQHEVVWYEDNCTENNLRVVIGKEDYFLSADGFQMLTRKDQTAPDLRYFNQTKK
jgi:hypothetical protein